MDIKVDELGIERRTTMAEVELRESDRGPVITGYAALFNVLSEDLGNFRETIKPGAFKDAIMGDVRALWQHDPSYVLGRTTNGTLLLNEDYRGLRVEITPPDTTWARDAVTSIKRGDVSQMSFGFTMRRNNQDDSWEASKEGQRRTIVRVDRLLDVSPVTFPAYPQTSIDVRTTINNLRAQVLLAELHDEPDDEPDDGHGRAENLREWFEITQLEAL